MKPFNPILNRIAVLGLFLAGLGALFPLVLVKANRLVAGTPLGLMNFQWLYLLFFVLWLGIAVAALSRVQARGWLLVVIGNLFFMVLLVAISQISSELGANPISRVSPAAGFWLLLLGAWLVAYAGALEVKRSWLAGLGLGLAVLLLGFGAFDHLSVLREYTANQTEFWQEVGRHLYLSFLALLFSSFLGIILGVYSASRPRASSLALGVANALQTIPSIALFALLIPFFSGLARAFPTLETLGVRGIGIYPALTALILYGLLPVLRGTILGLQGVPDAPLEAAKGLGYTPNQVFWRVRLPLAVPLMLEGLRLTAVSLVGLAALSSLIGAGGLGGFIFTGLGSGAIDRVLLGAIPTLVLALLVNSAMRGLEVVLTPKGLH